jgi:hypothetical protein
MKIPSLLLRVSAPPRASFLTLGNMWTMSHLFARRRGGAEKSAEEGA